MLARAHARTIVILLAVATLSVVGAWLQNQPTGLRASIVNGPLVFNGHTYYVVSENTWSGAEAEAASLGGHLVTINEAAEQAWITMTIGDGYWIGLHLSGSDYVWASGEPVTFENWATGEPNNGCGNGTEENSVHLTGNGQWNDVNGDGIGCLGPIPAIIELPWICGDGIVDTNEVCDSGSQNGLYGSCSVGCSQMGPHCGDGTRQSTFEECDDGNAVNTDACTAACQTARCGDGMVQSPNGTNIIEACDDGPLNGQYGKCSATCTGPGPRCGDGIIQTPQEQCELGGASPSSCTAACQKTLCGDGTVQNPNGYGQSEQCDNGTANNGFTKPCNPGCFKTYCGDGTVQSPNGNGEAEQCDGGALCTSVCKNNVCGDGYKRGTEECDDGNTVNTDSCTNTCKNPVCGDGYKQGSEECDDGNTVSTDSCTSSCKNATCGDGIVHAGTEACDDGNAINTDACSNTCALAGCGDGIVQTGEECDSGTTNNGSTKPCNASCKKTSCGDGVVQAPNGATVTETCDDGAQNGQYGKCAATCTGPGPRCGDGTVQSPQEACDGGPGCSTACTLLPSSSSSSLSAVSSSVSSVAPSSSVVSSSVSSCSAASSPPNLVRNGSFEQGNYTPRPAGNPNADYNFLKAGSTNITDWRILGQQLGGGLLSGVDWKGSAIKAADGQRAIDMDGTPGPGGVEQDIATVAGQWYTVDFAMSANFGCAQEPDLKELSLTAGGTTGRYSYDIATTTGWKRHTFTFKATGASTTLRFQSLSIISSGGNYCGAALDDVHAFLSPCGPGPSTAAGSASTSNASLSQPVVSSSSLLSSARPSSGTSSSPLLSSSSIASSPATIASSSVQLSSLQGSSSSLCSAPPQRYCCDNGFCAQRSGCVFTVDQCLASCGASTSSVLLSSQSSIHTSSPAATTSAVSSSSSVSSSFVVLAVASSSDASSSSIGLCFGDECALGGNAWCAAQGQTCTLIGVPPCFACVGPSSPSAASSTPRLAGQGVCGDGVLQRPNADGTEEECDNGDGNGPDEPCSAQCTKNVLRCGDGRVLAAEQCDDGNTSDGDGCSSVCRTEVAACGNGMVEVGEQCDNGAENSDVSPGACRADCRLPRCGDAVIDLSLSEECDLGNGNGSFPLRCRTNCRLPVCGDGLYDNGEECDDGNVQSYDGCSSTCHVENTLIASQVEPGQACASDAECAAGVCVGGQCLVLGCNTHDDCPSRLCSHGWCAACSTDRACASGRCEEGVCQSLQPVAALPEAFRPAAYTPPFATPQPPQGPLNETGPAAVAAIAGGAAAGYSWVRRRRRTP